MIVILYISLNLRFRPYELAHLNGFEVRNTGICAFVICLGTLLHEVQSLELTGLEPIIQVTILMLIFWVALSTGL